MRSFASSLFSSRRSFSAMRKRAASERDQRLVDAAAVREDMDATIGMLLDKVASLGIAIAGENVIRLLWGSSSQNLIEFDCKGKKRRTLVFVSHSENMGEGKVIFKSLKPGQWHPVPHDSVAEQILGMACEH